MIGGAIQIFWSFIIFFLMIFGVIIYRKVQKVKVIQQRDED